MIFVTVGTHEQSFDRLLKYIDDLVEKKIIKEEVIVQKGYTDYILKNCNNDKLLPYDLMQKYVNDARIVITHGGPASFISALCVNKIPIVVPRKKDFNEHVNNHQLEFAREVSNRMNNIIVCEDEKQLEDAIINYDKIIKKMISNNSSNNNSFCNELQNEINKLFND